jgi:hypothetical protein
MFGIHNPAFLAAAGGGGAPPAPSTHATAADWAVRVVTNGGAAVAQATIDALSDFMDALDAASLTSKMIAVNCLVADNLIAATTPLIVGPGLDPWTNTNFSASELSVNGLNSAGAVRWLDTGVVPKDDYASDADCGLTLYNMTAINESVRDAGSVVGGYGSVIVMHISLSAQVFWDSWNASDRVQVSNSLWTGYISGNRHSTNTQVVYRANSSTSHAVLGTRNGLVSSKLANIYSIYIYASNESGSPTFSNNKRFSFAAVHDGLTTAQSSDLYDAVQAMRTALGGGYV